jgi:NADPH:quinone reductase
MSNPTKFKAVLLNNYNPNLIRALGQMKLTGDVSLHKPGPGKVLIKLDASPINPSDIAFLLGGYNIVKTLPAVPGFEGTGVVVETGKNVDVNLVGRRVSFFNQDDNSGAWAEYTTVAAKSMIVLDYELPVEQAACLFVNPFTAYALMEHVLEKQHRAIIQSASNGQVGEFIRYFAAKHGIKVINLVRKPGQVETMTNDGIENVLNVGDEHFGEQLKEMTGLLHATLAIDAVGGELSGKLLNAMPSGSELLLYGGLSGLPVCKIDTIEIIFKNKTLSGFYLNNWKAGKTAEEFWNISIHLQKLIYEKEIQTKIHQVFPLSAYYDAIRNYISAMSKGKVILKTD